jgi:quaternary ammonium compound-resistance protein SugE
MGWLYLLAAGVFEIGFTTSMRYIDWSLRPMPIIVFLITSTLSFGFLIAAMQTVPLGTSYAVWTGIGAVGTALIGVFWYAEPAGTLRLLFLFLLIASIVGLKLVSAE